MSEIYAVRIECRNCRGNGYKVIYLMNNPPIQIVDCPVCTGTGTETVNIKDDRIMSRRKKLEF